MQKVPVHSAMSLQVKDPQVVEITLEPSTSFTPTFPYNAVWVSIEMRDKYCAILFPLSIRCPRGDLFTHSGPLW